MTIKKKIFPAGIFLLLFMTELIISAGVIWFYFINTGKKEIQAIDDSTRIYSKTMIHAFADISELCYSSGKYRRLNDLFQNKIRENAFDEAFLVLNNGKLKAHSSKSVKKSLNGNIATDEFTYNIDMILLQAKKKSKEAVFLGYNLINNTIPFERRHRFFLKEYMYKEIDQNGWLCSKAVYHKKKPVGTVNILISKDKIYSFINSHIQACLYYLKIATAGSAVISLIISIIVLLRYRSIQEKTFRETEREMPVIDITPERGESPAPEPAGIISETEEKKPVEISRALPDEDSYITIELLSEDKGTDRTHAEEHPARCGRHLLRV